MPVEIPTELSQGENSENKHSKLRISRDALFVVAGVLISMSAGINPWQSILYVKESVRYLEQKFKHYGENP